MNDEIVNSCIIKQRSVFINRNFQLLFSGKVISQLGDQIYAFALSWYILDVTKSGIQMASFLVIDNLSVAVVSMFGGVIADRFNRKLIMVWTDIIRGLVVITVAILFYNHMLRIWMLYISAIFLGSCGAVFTPASAAILPNIAEKEQLAEAISMSQFVFTFCAATGFIISGALYNLTGVFVLFMINAVSYFVSAILENNIALKFNKTINAIKSISILKETKKVFKELFEGVIYVKNNALIFNLLLTGALTSFIIQPTISVYIPYLFNVILKSAPLQLALALSGGWIGLVIGSVIAPGFVNRYKIRKIIFLSLLSYSFCEMLVSLALFPQVQSNISNWNMTYIFMFGGIILGIGLTSFFVTTSLLMQQFTSDEYRGRFWGLNGMVTAFLVPIGYLIGGILVKYIGMFYIFAGVSISMLIINLWLVNLKVIKECIFLENINK